MCGIFALSAAATWRSTIEPALEAIGHRGPDDRGSFVSADESCLLGQVRLSILDLSSAGHQPMPDSSGRFVLVYNGEVYNFGELKRDIEDRHGYINWRSSSDTEVIVEGFARDGKEFLSRLNGMFSLAIFDTHERLLHVLRDPLGIKPLFVTAQSGTVYFCSELKGLLAIDGLRRSVRMQSLADMIGFMYIPEPHTFFQEFQKVSPGILFSYRDGVQLAASELFDLRSTEAPLRTESEIVTTFAEKFSTAVKRQLIADVPISIMLSGGLDSSAIAYEAVNAGARVRDAYTISFASEDMNLDQQSDDLSFAQNMSKQLGIKLNVIEANRGFMNILPELCGFLEDGISDPAAINTYLICKDARVSGTKVMLTGQGADEFMFGYRRHQAERMIQKMPQIMRQPARLVGELLPVSIPGGMNSYARRLKRLLQLAGATRNERLLGMYSWCQPETVERLFSNSQRLSFAKELRLLIENKSEKDTSSFMLKVDQSYDLRSLNLVYSDRMSMAAGVEARVPFLDFELVRLMNSLPIDWHIKNGQTKYVLRKAMENKLPHDLIYREKAGFGLPLRSWLRTSPELVEYYLNHNRIEKQGIFSSKSISDMLRANTAGKADFSNAIFSLVIIQILLDHFRY
jgi:asparagine synthase (glutamine-hydrolysing)